MTDRSDTGASRRTLLRTGLAGAAAAATALAAGAARAQAKIAPAMVQYQAMPKDGKKCADCAQFVAPASCKIVDGTIKPEGWCIAFAAKS